MCVLESERGNEDFSSRVQCKNARVFLPFWGCGVGGKCSLPEGSAVVLVVPASVCRSSPYTKSFLRSCFSTFFSLKAPQLIPRWETIKHSLQVKGTQEKDFDLHYLLCLICGLFFFLFFPIREASRSTFITIAEPWPRSVCFLSLTLSSFPQVIENKGVVDSFWLFMRCCFYDL